MFEKKPNYQKNHKLLSKKPYLIQPVKPSIATGKALSPFSLIKIKGKMPASNGSEKLLEACSIIKLACELFSIFEEKHSRQEAGENLSQTLSTKKTNLFGKKNMKQTISATLKKFKYQKLNESQMEGMRPTASEKKHFSQMIK